MVLWFHRKLLFVKIVFLAPKANKNCRLFGNRRSVYTLFSRGTLFGNLRSFYTLFSRGTLFFLPPAEGRLGPGGRGRICLG